MRKIFYSLMALTGMMLAASCSDSDITENTAPETPQAAPQKIYLNASIPSSQTRISYAEIEGGMKMYWNKEDYLMVFPEANERKDVRLSTHDYPSDMTDTDKEADPHFSKDEDGNWVFTSDKAYLFEIEKGEDQAMGTFVHKDKVVYYEETEYEKDETVSSASAPEEDKTTVKIRVKEHKLVEKSLTEAGMTALDISDISDCLAMWEHPDNESGDCQTANNSTKHLKYKEVLTATVNSGNFTTDAEGKVKPLELKHPKTVIFKIIMNQFLYDIHRGAHVGIRTLKPGTITGTFEEDEVIDGVYHQARSEFFEYEQKYEPAKILTVTPVDNGLGYGETKVGDKVFAGDLTHTLTTYIMVDASKLAGKRYFQFSLTDNWSHDLYVWRLDLGESDSGESKELTGDAGKFYTIDLTNRVCNQFVWLGNNDYVWAIRNHKATNIKDDGLYYRYGELEGQESTYDNDNYTPDNYTANVQSTWLSTLRGIKADDVVNIATTGEYWKLREDFTLPDFLIDLGITYDLNHLKYQEYRIKYQYDAIYMDTKGLARMPSATYVARIYDDCDITLNATFDGETGAILSHKTTKHKIFIPNTKTKRPSGWSNSTVEVDDKTNQVRIITSTYPINVVAKGNSSESWGAYVYYKKSNGEYETGLNKKAIYHGFTMRGIAPMLHKTERTVSGSVAVSGEN